MKKIICIFYYMKSVYSPPAIKDRSDTRLRLSQSSSWITGQWQKIVQLDHDLFLWNTLDIIDPLIKRYLCITYISNFG